MRKRFLLATSLLAVLAIVGTSCTNSGGASTTPTSGGSSGGTYRTATQEFGYTDAFDPTGEYLGTAWGLYGQLLLRGLMTYNHKSASEGGDTPVPDIASAMPQVSSDGLTYTFKLRTNVMFGPPVNRAVTSHDIEYAFERINLASLAAQYGNYYDGVIKGMTGSEKSLHPVSGISTPDDSTIIFHLTQPTGDLLYRLSMPATAAIPQEVAKCFTKAGDYGRYVISSGPYMIMGEDQLDMSSCSTMKPISGYNPDKGVTFVKNPAFQADSESSGIRGNSLDGIQIAIDSNVNDIFQQIQAGTLDGSYNDAPPLTVERQYSTDPNLKADLHVSDADRMWYLTLNPLAPPFDDVHVRRAVQYVLDKASMNQALGGSVSGVPATAIEPPSVNSATEDQDIYPSQNNAGDVTQALAEMKQSSYSHDSTGRCIDAACKGFTMLGDYTAPWPHVDQVILADLKKIGLHPKLTERGYQGGYSEISDVAKLVPLSSIPGWGKDFADPFGFDYFILDSAGIGCTTATNYYLVGMTASLAKRCGVQSEYNAYVAKNGPMLSVDNAINQCEAQTGQARLSCFGTKVDAPVMKSAVIVPWSWANNVVVTGSAVTNYQYDANAGTISLCWVTVNNGLAPVTSLRNAST